MLKLVPHLVNAMRDCRGRCLHKLPPLGANFVRGPLVAIGLGLQQLIVCHAALAGLPLQLHDPATQRDRVIGFGSRHGFTDECPKLGGIDRGSLDLVPVIIIGRGRAVVVGADARELDQLGDIRFAGNHPALAGLKASQRPGDFLRDVLGHIALQPFLDRRLIGRQRQPVSDQRLAAAQDGVMEGLGPLCHDDQADALGPPGRGQLLGKMDGQVLAAKARPLLGCKFMRLFDDQVEDAAHLPQQGRRELGKEGLQATRLEVGHVDDGQREIAACDQLADRLAGRFLDLHMTVRSAQDLERQPRPLAVGTGYQPPPVGFDRVQDADAGALGHDVLYQQLGSAGLAGTSFSDDGGMLADDVLEDLHAASSDSAGAPVVCRFGTASAMSALTQAFILGPLGPTGSDSARSGVQPARNRFCTVLRGSRRSSHHSASVFRSPAISTQ
ncbi:MAG TPA: hypothetical protein VND94_00675 [Terriglobia bacterium]|nr:hypothetical protein [Terriglobia bacterium]